MGDGKLNLIMGARNGAKNSRETNDFYATHPSCVRLFLDKLEQDGVALNKNIIEPACGQGHMAEVFKEYGYNVEAFDLIDRGYGRVQDFFLYNEKKENTDYITNPPFKVACDFARHALTLLGADCKLCLFLKIQFLESKERRELFNEFPPKYVYVYSDRQQCSMNGDFENLKAKTQAYIWVIWEKGYKGESIIRWI